MSKLPSLNSLRKVHIIGVCGTLMGAFAAYLKRQGIEVSGSDQNVYPPMSDVLSKAGVHLLNGYRAENLVALGEKPDLVVIGNVIRSDNPEAIAAKEQGQTITSLPEAMEHLFLRETRNLVVAGTHGKTTTSSLLAFVLSQWNQNPNFFIGGVPQDLPFSFHIPNLNSQAPFVLEGDEYDTAFWDKVPKFNHYLPDDVILTSVEYDHADIYPNLEAVIQAFEGLIRRIRPGGQLIACYDYETVRNLAKLSKVPVISYGSAGNQEARFTPGKVRFDEKAQLTCFEILDHGKKVDEISIQIPGNHNVLNALSVWILCKGMERKLGISFDPVRTAFKNFRGVKRRQEIKGEIRGVLVIDDFAHHPTAVKETLKALRMKYPHKRLVSVFEPRSATSRRKVFQKSYGEAFQEADLVFIANAFDQSRISKEDQFSSEMLVKDLVGSGKPAYLLDSDPSKRIEQVIHQVNPGDLLAVLSNGGFGGFVPSILQSLALLRD